MRPGRAMMMFIEDQQDRCSRRWTMSPFTCEFKQPVAERLIDEEWKGILRSGGAPEQCLWV